MTDRNFGVEGLDNTVGAPFYMSKFNEATTRNVKPHGSFRSICWPSILISSRAQVCSVSRMKLFDGWIGYEDLDQVKWAGPGLGPTKRNRAWHGCECPRRLICTLRARSAPLYGGRA